MRLSRGCFPPWNLRKLRSDPSKRRQYPRAVAFVRSPRCDAKKSLLIFVLKDPLYCDRQSIKPLIEPFSPLGRGRSVHRRDTLFRSASFPRTGEFDPLAHPAQIGPKCLGRRRAVVERKIGRWDVAYDDPNPGANPAAARLDMKEEDGENATDSARKIRINDRTAPRE